MYYKFIQFLENGLYVPTPSASTIGAQLTANSPEEYFNYRQQERASFMTLLKSHFTLERINFCSIGAGFGGEEYLLKDSVKKTDPD